MKWQSKKPKQWDHKTKCRFLIFPKCINREWRWLEMATWIESYYDRWWGPDNWVD